jgi:D-glycero-beta-D-manno-heptose 1-phosphate adenylyltransferase
VERNFAESDFMRNKTKILATGAFDILHEEHLIFLKKAKELGGFLIVGIESDLRVKRMKGKGRPINNQELRLKNLLDLKIADKVFILPEEFDKKEDHLFLIEKIKPHILAVSSHTSHLEKKRKIMALVGGKLVVVHNHNPRVSSTKIIKSDLSQKSLD